MGTLNLYFPRTAGFIYLHGKHTKRSSTYFTNTDDHLPMAAHETDPTRRK
jgi:hypothetical protein